MPFDQLTQVTTDLDLQPFRERFPWYGGDLQTIATRFLSYRLPANSQRMEFPADEENTLVAALDRPATPKPGKPLVLLIHGVPGDQDSRDMVRLANYLLGLGHNVLRLNLRGAGPSRAICAGQYYAGSSSDIRAVLPLLPPELTKDGIVAVGHSIGGAVLLKYLGEEGSKSPIRAAVSVSAPIDLRDCCVSLLRFRNCLYHAYVMAGIRRNALGTGAVLTPLERACVEGAVNLWDYDDRFTARRNWFTGADDYYFKSSALNFLPDIRVPTLVLTSLDDPWVPGGAYAGFKWGSNTNLTALLLPRGGHVGFHGCGNNQPWSDLAAAKFFGSDE